jgi:hypothetical protein
MTQQETSLESLLSVTTLLPQALKSHLTDRDRQFLFSYKQNTLTGCCIAILKFSTYRRFAGSCVTWRC